MIYYTSYNIVKLLCISQFQLRPQFAVNCDNFIHSPAFFTIIKNNNFIAVATCSHCLPFHFFMERSLEGDEIFFERRVS